MKQESADQRLVDPTMELDALGIKPSQTLILLGAGAAIDAGAPDAFQLTEKIHWTLEQRAHDVDGSKDDPRRWQFQLFNSILGLLAAKRATQGLNPLQPPDAETVMSAIRLLTTRREDDLDPFVTGWQPAIDIPQLSVAKSQQLLKGLERQVLRTVAEILALSMSKDRQYVRPLLEWARTGAVLITLNYDRLIEEVANDAGIDLYLGLDELASGRQWSEPTSSVPYIKLHGSIDWQLTPRAVTGERNLRYAVLEQVGRETEIPGWPGEPAIIFGGRTKARFDGPFLTLYGVFRESLRRVNHVLVVGYSFRDDHVNQAIAEWIDGPHARTLTVVDPYFPEADSDSRWNPHSTKDELNWALANGGHGCRLFVHRREAREALPLLFGQPM